LYVPFDSQEYKYILVAFSILVLTGVLDDLWNVNAKFRLASQALVACIMVYGGGILASDAGNLLGFSIVEFGALSPIVSILVCVTLMNAFNFADGIDGLAGTLAAIAIGAIAMLEWTGGRQNNLLGCSIVVLGCIMGFLLFNLPLPFGNSFRAFMGDAGSTLLGLAVAWLGISVAQGESRAVSPIIAAWFVAIPLADLLTVAVRRMAHSYSPFLPGRDHLHHILLRGGFSGTQVLCILSGLSVLYVSIALIANSFGVPDVAMFIAWIALLSLQYRLIRKIAVYSRHRSVFQPR